MTGERRLRAVTAEERAGEIVRELSIDAPPDIVFSFFTDSRKFAEWQGHEADLDARPGGRVHIVYGPGAVVAGTFVEIDPPRRVVYTWGWVEEGSDVVPPGSSTVEVTLAEQAGGTLLRLRHYGLPAQAVEFHQVGWDGLLPTLAATATAKR